MKPVAFEALARLPVIPFYEAAFRKATGVALKLVPPGDCRPGVDFRSAGNPFCALSACSPASAAACLDTENQLQRSVSRKLTQQQVYCYAGLTVVAVPILVAGQHVATLMSGQIFRREPTERDFQIILKMLGDGLDPEWVKQARRAYFDTPVLTAERFQATLQLLNVFAQYVTEFAGRQAIACSEPEPEAVASAKQFVQAHVEEPITLDQVVDHVHVSRFYFCKLFKKATGMTLTEYVARVRVEKAKSLLVDPSLRISEVVFAAGFGSVPRFNSVFRQHTGMAPSEYRESLKSGPAVQ